MAGMMKPVSTILIAALLIMVAVVPRGEAVTCPELEKELQSCTPYILDKGPIGKCCDSIKKLADTIKTPADKKAACECLQKLGKDQKGINFEKVDGLPKECGADAPYIVIDSKTDCSKIAA